MEHAATDIPSLNLLIRLMCRFGVRDVNKITILRSALLEEAAHFGYSGPEVEETLKFAFKSKVIRPDFQLLEMDTQRADALLSAAEHDVSVEDVKATEEGISVSVSHPVMSVIAAHMVGWYRDSGADNYVELGIRDPDTLEEYVVTVQRVDGATPHPARVAAEERAAAMERVATQALALAAHSADTDEIERLRAELSADAGNSVDVLIGRWAVCSKGRIGRIEDRKTLPWGESWVGTGIDGEPWASRNPQVLDDKDAALVEPRDPDAWLDPDPAHEPSEGTIVATTRKTIFTTTPVWIGGHSPVPQPKGRS